MPPHSKATEKNFFKYYIDLLVLRDTHIERMAFTGNIETIKQAQIGQSIFYEGLFNYEPG